MKTSRNRILYLLAGCVIATVVFVVISQQVDEKIRIASWGELGKINILLENKIHVPISFWGSSTTLVHVSPRVIDSITGSSSFNFGLDGTFFQQYSGFLNKYSEQPEPSTIVIGLNITDFHPRTQIYHPHNYTIAIKDSNVYQALNAIDPSLSWKMRWVPFYPLVLYDSDHYLRLFNGPVQQTSLKDTRGFETQYRKGFTEVERFAYDTIKIHSPFVENLKSSINKLKSNGYQVVIFVSPIHASAGVQIKNLNDFNLILEQLHQDGTVVLDYLNSPVICPRTELFYNHMHLNSKGAHLFSVMLAHDLKKILRKETVNTRRLQSYFAP